MGTFPLPPRSSQRFCFPETGAKSRGPEGKKVEVCLGLASKQEALSLRCPPSHPTHHSRVGSAHCCEGLGSQIPPPQAVPRPGTGQTPLPPSVASPDSSTHSGSSPQPGACLEEASASDPSCGPGRRMGHRTPHHQLPSELGPVLCFCPLARPPQRLWVPSHHVPSSSTPWGFGLPHTQPARAPRCFLVSGPVRPAAAQEGTLVPGAAHCGRCGHRVLGTVHTACRLLLVIVAFIRDSGRFFKLYH